MSSCRSLVVENCQDPRAMTPVMQDEPSAPPVIGVCPVPVQSLTVWNACKVYAEHEPRVAMRPSEMIVLAFISRGVSM